MEGGSRVERGERDRRPKPVVRRPELGVGSWERGERREERGPSPCRLRRAWGECGVGPTKSAKDTKARLGAGGYPCIPQGEDRKGVGGLDPVNPVILSRDGMGGETGGLFGKDDWMDRMGRGPLSPSGLSPTPPLPRDLTVRWRGLRVQPHGFGRNTDWGCCLACEPAAMASQGSALRK